MFTTTENSVHLYWMDILTDSCINYTLEFYNLTEYSPLSVSLSNNSSYIMEGLPPATKFIFRISVQDPTNVYFTQDHYCKTEGTDPNLPLFHVVTGSPKIYISCTDHFSGTVYTFFDIVDSPVPSDNGDFILMSSPTTINASRYDKTNTLPARDITAAFVSLNSMRRRKKKKNKGWYI
jgi:hypothetical protein